MKPKCQHFSECGGCSFQDVPYEEQLREKEKNLIATAGTEEVSMIPSEKLYGFRNKMEFSFEGESLGLHPRGRFSEVIDLKECPVFSEWAGPFLDAVRKFASERGISYYGRRNSKGILRFLILRESKFTGEKMVILVISGNHFPYKKEWVETVSEALPGVKSIVLAKRHTTGDSALTEDYEILSGPDDGYIQMKIGGLSLDISPYSFFQPNSFQVNNLYGLISGSIEGECRILDLYSGIGSIPFFLDAPGRDITGVEEYPACTRDAAYNLEKIQPSANIKFVSEGVKSYVSGIGEDFDYIIVDPPRGGMSYRIWLHLKNFAERSERLKKVFYVCCSLKNLQQDVGFIAENTAWKMTKVTGVDQFVHTPHLETVVEYNI